MTGAEFSSSVISGAIIGSFYALLAGGLSIVWGTVRVFNFAHGTLLTFGAYVAWQVSDEAGFGYGIIAGLLAAAVVTGIAGALLGFVVVRPFLGRREAQLAVILTTLAAAVAIQNGLQIHFGPRLKRLERVADGGAEILGRNVSYQEIVIFCCGVLLLLAFYAFLKLSRMGLAIRAVEQNHEHALLVGIAVERTYLWVFAISASFAGVAGALVGALRFVTPTLGGDPLLKAFIVVIFGGLGSLIGTVVGAFVIGLIEAFSTTIIGLYWTPAVLFVALLIMMLLRPYGLLGKRES